MLENVELYISCIIMSVAFYIIGKILFEKGKKIKIKDIILVIGLSMILTIINLIDPSTLDNIIKVVVVFACYIGFYKLVFNEKIEKLILGSLITYLSVFAAEIIADISTNLIVTIFKYETFEHFRNSIEINLIISTIAVRIVYQYRNKFSAMIKDINTDKKGLIITSILILVTLAILLFKTPIQEIKLDSNFIITILLLILFCIIGFILIKQRH